MPSLEGSGGNKAKFNPYEHFISFKKLMTTTIASRRSGNNLWDQFCNWITSTNNRLYNGIKIVILVTFG